jgi:hypothetical protein
MESFWLGILHPQSLIDFKSYQNVAPGDFVFEMTSQCPYDERRFGCLEGVVTEQVGTSKNPRDNASQKVWLLQTTQGIVRWTNASFLKIPAHLLPEFLRLHKGE